MPFLQQHLDFGSPFLDYTVTKKLTALLKLTECSLHVLMVHFFFGGGKGEIIEEQKKFGVFWVVFFGGGAPE